ncbi:MAG: hypothetical protein QW776_03140 [Candidatus Nitrosocaldus sp.]
MMIVNSNLEDIIKKAINDKRIFSTPYEKRKLPEFFSNPEWKQLKCHFEKNNKREYNNLVNKRYNDVKKEYFSSKREKEFKKRYCALLNAYRSRQALLSKLFNTLEWYGVVDCNLPSMEDFGIMIERHSEAEVINFFCDKINREEKKWRKNAIKAALDYTCQLYKIGTPKESIAYFIRKLPSFIEYWELLDSYE